MTAIETATGVWRFQFHPEVWLLVGCLLGLYVYAIRVVGPKVVPEGEPILTRRQAVAAGIGLGLLWVASDWPVHDIGEQYLYLVHMLQHTLLTLVVPPLALIATPRWLADLILGQGRVRRIIRVASRPLVAGCAYGAMQLLVHWPALVNASVENGPLHYFVHVVLVFSALMMWMPVCGPIAEWRMGLPAQMIYLFLISIVPTVPGGWLTFADHAVYSTYDTPARAFGLTVQTDQQAAGVLMKLIAGGGIWVVITVMFFTWAFRQQREDEELDRLDRDGPSVDAGSGGGGGGAHPTGGSTGADTLTYDEVSRAFADSEPAPEPERPRPS